VGLILFLIWVILFLISFKRRGDLFSPLRIFLLNILIFWGAVFFKNYSIEVYVYVLFILVFGIFIWFAEGGSSNLYYRQKLYIPKRITMWSKLWMLTCIPIFAQVYMVNEMGGIEGYISSMALRNKTWEGLGVYILLIRSILVINLIYFLIIVKANGITRNEKIGYLLNFLVFITLALLTSSRSTLLVNIVIMFIIYYYYGRKINIMKIGAVGIILLFAALIIGAARNGGYTLENGEFTTGISNQEELKFEMANFEYGLFPLEKITEAPNVKNHYYGLTYLSALTNLIPRAIWAEKPDTGGVLFTRDYHDIHRGYSNYSTGMIVEGIMNFGYLGGTIFAFVVLFLIYKVFLKFTKRKVIFTKLRSAVAYFVVYPILLFQIPTFFHGEFTTVTHAIFIQKVLLIFLIVRFAIPKSVRYIEIK